MAFVSRKVTVILNLMEAAAKEHAPYPPLAVEQPIATPSRETPRHNILDAAWYKLTHWEAWDWRVKYILIAPAWLWFCLRARSFWFFTTANPTLTFGGFDGESKSEMYSQLPPRTVPKTIYASPAEDLHQVLSDLKTRGLSFPLAAKPDVGKMGLMFRRIGSEAELKAYHEKIGCCYILQEWVGLPLEVSVFYYRYPHSKRGTITGFIRKDYLEVTGNGQSTLEQLMFEYPRVRLRLAEMRSKHKSKLGWVPADGEKYQLSPALNLSRGGKLVSLEHEKDEALLKIFDDLSHYAGQFYYGRYDIKCKSIEDLKRGHFTILEFNGSGAEPHHVYGNGYTLWQACNILIAHWRVLCDISCWNRKAGTKCWNFKAGWDFMKTTSAHLERLKALDTETAVH